ncbi:hypothetical protein BCR39DRAFT_519195 [Naematelia encephala]|uniref:Alpha/Beta hydrolase protein n=1 Tax=Naematelia encephala TaxID=71784 RepID=A0A1Y2BH15_9TREE|nr:hypothetical protein BCR39DRAFT_519195 [Naematelia encephala]
MSLPAHLHLLIPSSSSSPSSSSTSNTYLEARLYLPLSRDAYRNDFPISESTRSSPTPYTSLADSLSHLNVKRLITAAHPWSKLGGSMLDPVISYYLLSAVFAHDRDHGQDGHTAVLTFNARGVGKSASAGWFDLGLRTDAEDFAAVERWGAHVLGGVKEIWRFGYSWGSMAALTASPPQTSSTSSSQPRISTMLLSPPYTIFRALTLLAPKSFTSALNVQTQNTNSGTKEGRVWLVYGTTDEFTSVSAYRGLNKEGERTGLVSREIEGAGHFWRGEDGERLELVISEWLADA